MTFAKNALPLLIFAKAPEPGRVKTRLIPALGEQGACELYTRLLNHTMEQTRAWAGRRYLYCAPDASHPQFTDLAHKHCLSLRVQSDGDLGQRMAAALAEFPQGALLIGTDCPVLDCTHLHAAAQALQNHDTAVIPSEDGGYVLIGQRQPNPAPFAGMTWSHARVLTDTQQRLHAAGLTLWLGPTLWDLDEPADLDRLPSDLAAPYSYQ